MNYYDHHIGDYDKNTAHLSACEDGMYCRLLRRYYDKERPLERDAEAIKRWARARNEEERAAVDAILAEFFRLDEDGWHNSKADEVIAAYLAGQPEREAKKFNEETRLARHRRERAALFAELNAAGEHLSYNVAMADLRAAVGEVRQRVSSGVSSGVTAAGISPSGETRAATPATAPATAPATLATATHTPITTPQSPLQKPSASGGADAPAKKGARRVPKSFQVTPDLVTWAAANAPDVDWVRQTERMRDWEYKHARTDWPAAWRTWMHKAQEEIDKERAKGGARRPGESAFAARERDRIAQATGGILATGGGVVRQLRSPVSDKPKKELLPHETDAT